MIRDRNLAGGILAAAAGLSLLVRLAGGDDASGWAAAGLLFALAAAGVLLLGPTPEQLAARRRARSPKYFQATPMDGRR